MIVMTKKIGSLFIGYFLLAFGIAISVVSNVGLSPWDVFNQGLALTFNTSIGFMNICISLGVVVIASLIKVYPSIGTILNTICIGLFIDVVMPFVPEPSSLIVALLMNIVGVFCIALGTVVYLQGNAGAGPRDSLLLGLMYKFKVDTTYVKPILEGIVLVIGVILGGKIGIGTVFALLLIGYFMDILFRIFKYDPKEVKQMNLVEQWQYLKEVRNIEGSCT